MLFSWPERMAGRARSRNAFAFAFLTISLSTAYGQQNAGGFGFYGSSAFTTLTTSPPVSGGAGALFGAGGGATFGYIKNDPSESFTVLYTPSYAYTMERGLYNSMSWNHGLVLSARTKIRRKLFLQASAVGQMMQVEQNLFGRSLFSQITGSSATFDELASSITTGTAAGDALGSVLSGAQKRQSEIGGVALGNRYAISSAAASLSYRSTPRLSYTLNATGTRTQALASGGPSASGIPAATTATAGAGLSYSVSPRTQLGLDLETQRSWSPFGRGYASTAGGSIGRIAGLHWFFQAHGGVGFSTVQNAGGPQPGPQYVAGSTAGYKNQCNTFLLSLDRSIVDSYGLGASKTLVSRFAWSFERPGRRWSTFADFDYQLRGYQNLPDSTIWRGTAGWNRQLNRETNMTIAYAYGMLVNSAVPNGNPLSAANLAPSHGVQIAFFWHPAKNHF